METREAIGAVERALEEHGAGPEVESDLGPRVPREILRRLVDAARSMDAARSSNGATRPTRSPLGEVLSRLPADSRVFVALRAEEPHAYGPGTVGQKPLSIEGVLQGEFGHDVWTIRLETKDAATGKTSGSGSIHFLGSDVLFVRADSPVIPARKLIS